MADLDVSALIGVAPMEVVLGLIDIQARLDVLEARQTGRPVADITAERGRRLARRPRAHHTGDVR